VDPGDQINLVARSCDWAHRSSPISSVPLPDGLKALAWGGRKVCPPPRTPLQAHGPAHREVRGALTLRGGGEFTGDARGCANCITVGATVVSDAENPERRSWSGRVNVTPPGLVVGIGSQMIGTLVSAANTALVSSVTLLPRPRHSAQ